MKILEVTKQLKKFIIGSKKSSDHWKKYRKKKK